MGQLAKNKYFYVDDATDKIGLLVRLRLPWLLVGLIGGIITTVVVSKFEALLVNNIRLAFFVPIIVFMADAVGEQTETIFIRNITKGKIEFWVYFFKELVVGVIIGLTLGSIMAIVSYLWLGSLKTSVVVGLAMMVTVAIGPIIALIISNILYRCRVDPALGSGPFTTVAQDLLSLCIYFLIASLIIVS